jgi:hypothetical protein
VGHDLPYIAALLIAVPGTAAPPGSPSFVDVTASSGLVHLHHDGPAVPPLFPGQNARFGGGAAVGDYDGDGDPDVYLCDSYPWPNRLFSNDGDGTFTDVTAASGAGDTGFSHMALFVDLDNDGDQDLVVINDCSDQTTEFPCSQLYRNDGDGTFTNVTEGSGFLPVEPTMGGATAGDYDGDGDLDLLVVGWFYGVTHLYRNDGGFEFTDVTDDAHVRPDGHASQWTPVFVDVDNDGRQDIFCAVDFGPDYLLHNNGDGTFTDVTTEAGTVHIANDMGVGVADFDEDGDLDLYTTNISGQDDPDGFCTIPTGCNMLYVNRGDGTFEDGTLAHGVGDTWWGWGVWFFDADLDGRRDLLAVNGWTQKYWQTPSTFFHNREGVGFVESAEEAGLGRAGNTRALVPIDHDLDGDVDFLMTDVLGPAYLYENRTERGDRHWVTVTAEGRVSNRDGVGARVTVTAGGRESMSEIIVGGSFYAAPPLEAHFGLGSATVIDELRVDFPSGRSVRRCGLAPDQRIHVIEPGAPPCPGDLDASTAVGLSDLLLLLAAWGPCPPCCEADLDTSGAVDAADVQVVLRAWGGCP